MSSSPFRVVLPARRSLVALVGLVFALSAAASDIKYNYTNGRLTSLSYPDGTVVQYSYDANGNRTDAIVTPGADTIPPTTPGNLVATAVSQTQIGLTWSVSTDNVGVTVYEVQRCAGSGCSSFTTIGTAATTNYSDTGLTQNTTYRYRIRAGDAANNFSGYSAIASSTTVTDATPPSTPGTLSATAASGSQVNLSWGASTDSGGSNLSGYKIERCQGSGCSGFVQIASTSSTSYADSTLSSGVTYLYRVRAYDGAGNHSGYSNAPTVTTLDDVAPSAPTGLAAAAPSSSTVNLTWTGSTDNVAVTGYRVYRGGTQIGTTTATNYTDNSVSGSTAYSYTVSAYDAAGNNSPTSNTAPVTTPDTIAPGAPSGLTATAPSSTQVNLSWSAVSDTGGSGLAGYKIYRGGSYIATTSATNYTDNSVSGSTAYSYTVSAYDNAGNNSAMSNTAPVTTPDTIAPGVPGGLTAAAASATQVNLSWNAVSDTGGSGLAGYRIYRGGSHIANSGVTSYSDTSVSGSTSYSYTVAGYDNAGNTSGQSSAAGVTTPAPPDTTPPSVPTGVAATLVGDNQINVSWSASTDTGGSGMAGYRIYRGGVQIGTSSTTSFADTTVSPFNSYSYTVASYDGAVNVSSQSSAAGAVTYIVITNTSGDVVASASSLYIRTMSCPVSGTCFWYVRKNYGDMNTVVSVQGTSTPACVSGTTSTLVAGYQRVACELRAAPSKYGQ